MKTCKRHGYNPPSHCPNCRISARRAKRSAARKGWQTRRLNARRVVEVRAFDQEAEFEIHGWVT